MSSPFFVLASSAASLTLFLNESSSLVMSALKNQTYRYNYASLSFCHALALITQRLSLGMIDFDEAFSSSRIDFEIELKIAN